MLISYWLMTHISMRVPNLSWDLEIDPRQPPNPTANLFKSFFAQHFGVDSGHTFKIIMPS